jgi:peroxiredoxin
MKARQLATLVAASLPLCLAAGQVYAVATVGQAAPTFSLKDTNGKTINLADYKGKTVVLEWHNPECPFVKKHYSSTNIPALQSKYTKEGTVWLAISSTETSHQDYKKPEVLNAMLKSGYGAPSAYLMDESGSTGKSYGAKTTPHMYIINREGTLVYAGGIDDKRSADVADIKVAKNYVAIALEEMKAGKNITTATSTPYGCSVKYKS